MRTRSTLATTAPLLLTSLALATPRVGLAAPPSESPVQVGVQLRAPFISGVPNLWGVEDDALVPFYKDFAIPYETLEDEIQELIDDAIPNNVYGTETCTDPCPDVEWRVKLAPKFKFTKKGQPKLTQIGSSGQSKVRVEVETKARFDLHADVFAETWIDSVQVPVDVFIVVGMKASVDVSLWPDLVAKQPGSSKSGVKLEFELIDTDIEFDLNGTAVGLGFKWGTIVGFTPLGLLAGGPILGPVLALFGDEAADQAEARINAEFDKYVERAFAKQTEGLTEIANDYIDPYIAQANSMKDKVLDTPIPGVNKTIEQMKADFGADLQLHTVAETSSVFSAGVLRMSGAANGGKIFGKVRVPKEVCHYAGFSVGGVKGTLPLGLVEANTDLDAKVGQACSAALGDEFARKVYRGANPRAFLGSKAESLPEWSGSAGTLAYVGNLSETNDWYECSFELTGLPKAAILQFSADGLGNRGISLEKRFMVAMVGGKSRVFNEQLTPVAEGSGGNSGVIIGGKGVCGGGSSSGGLTPNKMKALKDSLNPENCPTCGMTKQPGSHVYEPADVQAFASTPIVKEILAKAKLNAAKVNTAKPKATAGAKPAGAKPAGAKPAQAGAAAH